MTKEDIARMAREAGWFEGQANDVCIACSRFGINRFAELVAAYEREECAKVCVKRQWVGLDDEEYQTILSQLGDGGLLAFYILIESKLKEKNT
jgi:hypothetical protein